MIPPRPEHHHGPIRWGRITRSVQSMRRGSAGHLRLSQRGDRRHHAAQEERARSQPWHRIIPAPNQYCWLARVPSSLAAVRAYSRTALVFRMREISGTGGDPPALHLGADGVDADGILVGGSADTRVDAIESVVVRCTQAERQGLSPGAPLTSGTPSTPPARAQRSIPPLPPSAPRPSH